MPRTRSRRASQAHSRGAQLACAWLALSVAAVNADEPAASPPVPNVTIEGQRPTDPQRVQDFVAHITVKGSGESLVTWHQPICTQLSGLKPGQADLIQTRLAQIIRTAGAPLAPKECRANFHVMVTQNPEQLIDAWAARDKAAGGAAERAARKLRDVARPVRVWYNTDLKAADGTALGTNCPGIVGAPGEFRVDCSASASQLKFNELTELDSLVVIVDLGRTADFGLGQIADYIAMVGLARINLDAHVADAPTILNLFTAARDDRPQGLSAWDAAFLSALYGTNSAVHGQAADIARSMLGGRAR